MRSTLRGGRVFLVGGALLAGCTTPVAGGGAGVGNTEEAATQSQNGLTMINGLTMVNGLNTMNGLTMINGLNTMNGLADGVGLMSSAAGRSTLSYLVKCALPSGHSITKHDQNGTSYTFAGKIGVAPEWEWGACSQSCEEQVSACMLAHVNTTGKNINLWLDGDSSAIGWGRSTDFPYQEGSFFGNIFTSPPQAYYCNGRDFDQGVVPGRLGVGQTGAPYVNPFGSGAYCNNNCAGSDYPNTGDGYKACHGFNHVVTVWRNFDANTDYKVCSRQTGLCLDVNYAGTADGTPVDQYTYYGGTCQKWRIAQVSPGHYTFKNVNSGKVLDILNASTANGAALVQWTANGSTNQQWSLTPTGDGYYKFSPASQPSASLDIPNGTSALLAFIQQWIYTGSAWQQWNITPAN